jgi:hypothetical protein
MVLDYGLAAEWRAINNRAGSLYKRRNVLAHGELWTGDNNEPSTLRFSVFDEGNTRTMTYLQVYAQWQSFERFADRLTQYAIDVNAWLTAPRELTK